MIHLEIMRNFVYSYKFKLSFPILAFMQPFLLMNIIGCIQWPLITVLTPHEPKEASGECDHQ